MTDIITDACSPDSPHLAACLFSLVCQIAKAIESQQTRQTLEPSVCVLVCVGWLAGWLMSPGGVLWSVGSRGEILSQPSNYKAEPHSKDMQLIDYTPLTSNKTKVEKTRFVRVSLCVRAHMCFCHSRVVRVCVGEREKKERKKNGRRSRRQKIL